MRQFGAEGDQKEFAGAVAAVLARHDLAAAVDATPELWSDLAEVGVLGLCTDAVGGTLRDLVVVYEALGHGLCPGPVVAAAAAAELLSPDDGAALAAGKLRVTCTDGKLVPWAASADLVLRFGEDAAVTAGAVPSGLEETTGISGEPWGSGSVPAGEPLADGTRARAVFDLALSAYLLGAARRLVEQGSRHAATRRQFGKPLGAFQAVSHPLANAWADVGAARALSELVATEFTVAAVVPERARLLRRASTRASVGASLVVHQAMGAMSYSVETGVSTASTRIRQWSLLPPA